MPREEGFSGVRIALGQCRDPEHGRKIAQFHRAMDYHGDMDWLATTAERRAEPKALWPEAQSAIVFAMNYGQGLDALERLEAQHPRELFRSMR